MRNRYCISLMNTRPSKFSWVTQIARLHYEMTRGVAVST